jgi:hypothetical protein
VHNPDLSTWPDLFGFCWASVVWAFVYYCVVSQAAHYPINALRYSRVVTPIVAPEHFCDHEVIVKVLVCTYVVARTCGCSLFGLYHLAPYWSMYSMQLVTIKFCFVRASR